MTDNPSRRDPNVGPTETPHDLARLPKPLLAAKRGGAERHVHGGTICPMCHKVTMRVTSTSDTKRYMKCDACGYRRTFARTA